MVAYANGLQYHEATHRMKIALWVARRNRPFSIVEDPKVLDIFHDLNFNCITPKQRTVACDVLEIFVSSRKKVGELLQVGLLSSSIFWSHYFLGVSGQSSHSC